MKVDDYNKGSYKGHTKEYTKEEQKTHKGIMILSPCNRLMSGK